VCIESKCKSNLAYFQSIPYRPLLALIYKWPGLKDREGSSTYYNIGIRHELVSWLRLHLGLVLTGLRGTQLTGSIIYTLVSRSVEALKQTLKKYCDGSWQKINLDKSSIFFGNRCVDSTKESVKNCLDVHNEILNDFYLGMPTSIGSSPTATFKFLYDMIWKRINSVIGRPVSRAWKEVFLKATIQAILTFVMSCFQAQWVIANECWVLKMGRKTYTSGPGSGYPLLNLMEAWVFET
jgi:hypothetical protein